MYQALYRKYRPKNFSDVYGQDHIVSTLRNEIKENRISHAYLFSGSRGTGKTTCAKILAKAVNCENSIDGEPCNECEVCKGLDSGAIYDVVEIDAASNNGVNDIRVLREEVNYTPSRCKYRVYIIDEVHMLSSGAFNALLKTLEEPPSHVIFILATTEVHKLPATILSRCQRFDFKRIQPETMAVRLKQVAEMEGFELEQQAACLIARLADGALRDGLSILDQCAGRSNVVDTQLVSQVAGLTGRQMLFDITDSVVRQDSSSVMNTISSLYQNSYDMERLCTELINHYRNLLVAKTVNDSRSLILSTDDEYELLIGSAKSLSVESIILGLDLFQASLTRIKSGSNARIEMEMALIKLCEPKLDKSYEALIERISKLERSVQRGAVPALVSTPVANEKPKSAPITEPVLERDDTEPVKIQENQEQTAKMQKEEDAPDFQDDTPLPYEEKSAYESAPNENESHSADALTPSNETVLFDKWGEFLDVIHTTDIALFGVISSATGYIRGEHFLIDSSNPTVRQFIKIPTHSKAIKSALYEVTGQKYKLGLFKKKPQETQKRDLLDDLINQAQNNVKIDFK